MRMLAWLGLPGAECLNKDQAQKIIDEATSDTSQVNYPSSSVHDIHKATCFRFAFGDGAKFILQLLRDRPELLVAIPEPKGTTSVLEVELSKLTLNNDNF